MVHPAALLLAELHDNGVLISLADGELELHPFSKITQDQIILLGVNGQVLEQLLQLQFGQSELNEDHNAFMDGGGSEEFGRLFDEWYSRDQLLRNVLRYTGCIYGDGKECPDTVVRCEQCVPTQKKRRFKKL